MICVKAPYLNTSLSSLALVAGLITGCAEGAQLESTPDITSSTTQTSTTTSTSSSTSSTPTSPSTDSTTTQVPTNTAEPTTTAAPTSTSNSTSSSSSDPSTTTVTTTASSSSTTTSSTVDSVSNESTATGETAPSSETGPDETGTPQTSAAVVDDFEAGAAGSPPDSALWSIPTGRSATAVVLSGEQKKSGNQSVKVTYGSGAGPSMFYNTSVFPLPNGVLHFRVWAWFDSIWETHVSFASAGPLPIEDYGNEIRFGGQHGIYYVNDAKSDDFSPDPWSCQDCVAPVAKTWTCLRGMLDFNTSKATLYVGDELGASIERDGWGHGGNITFPAPARLGLGFIDHNGGSNTAYFDDVALGYEPIACE